MQPLTEFEPRAVPGERPSTRERGAVLVEAALAFTVLMTLIFGVIEYGLQFKDSLSLTAATRSGLRTGTTQSRKPNYAEVLASAVATTLNALPSDAPETLWVYKGDPNNKGYPVGDDPTNHFTSCTYCEKFTWTQATRSWTCTNCVTTKATTDPLYYLWPWSGVSGTSQYACLPSGPPGYVPTAGTDVTKGPDIIGVYLVAYHKNFTSFFGPGRTLKDFTVGRLEPGSNGGAGCYN